MQHLFYKNKNNKMNMANENFSATNCRQNRKLSILKNHGHVYKTAYKWSKTVKLTYIKSTKHHGRRNKL